MDEGTKIRHLLNGIKTEKLKTVVELVRGNPDFDTFDSVVRRIKDTVLTLEPTKTPTRNISAVGVSKDPYPGVTHDRKMSRSLERVFASRDCFGRCGVRGLV